MSGGNAWRRFGASTRASIPTGDREDVWPRAAFVTNAFAALARLFQCALVIGALVFSTAAVVKTVDVLLDEIHD
jgi:hypothetical protein